VQVRVQVEEEAEGQGEEDEEEGGKLHGSGLNDGIIYCFYWMYLC
jgi:hypothetical protein